MRATCEIGPLFIDPALEPRRAAEEETIEERADV
jgi:hypothetical protein